MSEPVDVISASALLHEVYSDGGARTIYEHPEHDDIIVAIDTVTHAGIFVETEVTAADTDTATIHLEEVETELGIIEHPVVGLPYRDLVMAAAH